MSLRACMAGVWDWTSRDNHTLPDRLLLLHEQILEDELTPAASACAHQRATFVELSQRYGGEAELFRQSRDWSDRAIVVAREKDNPVAALYVRIGSERCRNEVVEAFHQLRTCERLCDDDGRLETVQLFNGNSIRVRRVDDRLAFPARQGLRNVA